ncbi:MAG: glutaminyl-peptide cyclotransferase [Candidatus Bathyarchaeota archaeon]|nr:glutaminyl-peptide cyclotransferase [Candidatus Termiticorpusculum sp.]
MKKTYKVIAIICTLAIAIGLVTFTLLTLPPLNLQQTATPSTSTSANTHMATSPNLKQPTFHGVPVYSYRAIQVYPHDSSAFTQGLTFDDDGCLIESTGLLGNSSLRRVNLVDGQVLQKFALASDYFGEGVTVVDDRVIQLTWRNSVGFVYDKCTFELLNTFSLDTEGWGLTYDGNFLIISDGTSALYFLDLVTYQVVKSINVYDVAGFVKNLNELEYVNGFVYANIWYSSKIAVINPITGQITAYIDLADLDQRYTSENSMAVLNGIAYNSQTGQLYVTGKLWSDIYEIEILWT